MKKKHIAIIILCLLLCLFVLSSCSDILSSISELNPTYKDMGFTLSHVNDDDPEEFKSYEKYYIAGHVFETKTIQYIPLAVHDVPVLQLGKPADLLYGGAKISSTELTTLYIPSTILRIGQKHPNVYVEKHAQNFKVFYCGAVVDLTRLTKYDVNDKCYVPAEKFEEFKNIWGTSAKQNNSSPDTTLFKANIKYRLNAEDMVDYYYIDYVESGTNIVNIPPEPERNGYTFDGWYIEKEGYTKWNFNSVPFLTATDSNPDGEFNLYAKWIKNK